MGIREIFGALGRRWLVVVIGVLVTLGAGWQVYQATPPEYTARGLVLLLPPVHDPTAAEEEGGANPFLELAGLDLTARVVVATYSSTAFEEELESVSEFAEVEVNIDDSTRGGIIAVDVKDRSAEQALRTLTYVTTSVSERLTSLQTDVGVQEGDAVRSMLLASDTEAKPDFQSLIRIIVIVIGVGLGLTIAITLTLDVILVRRRRRRGMFEPSGKSGPPKGSASSAASSAAAGSATEQPGSAPLPDLDDEPVDALRAPRKGAPATSVRKPASAPSGPRSAAGHNNARS